MTHINSAFDYHNELSKLKAIVDSIESTLEYVDAAFTHIEDPSSVVSMSLSMAQADLTKSLEVIRARHDSIKDKLSSSFF